MNLKQLKEEKIKRKCKEDPVFFINNFVKTLSFSDENPNGKVVPFVLWDFQEDFVRDLHIAYVDKTDIIVDKSRDMGVSWVNVAFDMWAWLFEDNFQCLWGSKKEDDVDHGGAPHTLFGKADIIIRNLPPFLLPKGFDPYQHRNFMRLYNPESQNLIVGESANKNFSRSGRYSKIFLDEFAFWDFSDPVWTATGDSSRHRILVSTPNGMGNTFADIRFGGNTKHVEMHWKVHKDKGVDAWFDKEQKNWRSPWYDKEVKRRLTAKDTSLKNIKQELDINYIQSGDPVFDAMHINRLDVKDKHPMPHETYAIGADVSEGLEGGDDSSFDVICKSTGEQVFSWDGKISTEDFAWKLIEYGNEYNNALLGIEINNAGIAVMNIVKRNYRKLYSQKRQDGRTNIITTKVGWHTNAKTKPLMITELQAALMDSQIKITYQKTIDELVMYEHSKSEASNTIRYGAPKGKHDDKVMSLAITWQVLQDVKEPLSEDERYRKERKKANKKRTRQFVSNTCGY